MQFCALYLYVRCGTFNQIKINKKIKDHVQGFWFKKATSLYLRLEQHLQECVNAGVVPTWMTEVSTILIMKDKSKGTIVGNYRPIACLQLML